MSEIEPTHLTGALMESAVADIQTSDFTRSGCATYIAQLAQSHWEQYTVTTDTPLDKEDQRSLLPPYNYTVICRRSGRRILAMSSRRSIVEYFISLYGRPHISPSLRHVSIAVDALVKELVARPTRYSLGFVHARVPAFGSSLRSVSFYGDDLAEASMFRENTQLMTFYICGLKAPLGGYEIVRLGSDGTISFTYSTSRRALEVEQVLRFLRDKAYLSSEVLGGD